VLSVCGEQPNSAANCFGDLAPLRNSRTASSRNSGGYGGLVLGISAPLIGPEPESIAVSTKPGQFQLQHHWLLIVTGGRRASSRLCAICIFS
jgi:hypothetical protein